MPGGAIIGVCGPMGTGKSTLAEPLATALGFTPRLERATENPFFRRYIEDPSQWSFWSQLAFILGAINEASLAHEDDGAVLERPAEEMLGVFVAELSRRNTLAEDESHLLVQVVAKSRRVAPRPDLLVVLRGEPRTLHRRLSQRAAVGDDSYRLYDIEKWGEAYTAWHATLDPNRVIDRDIDKVDLRSESEIQRLASEIKARLASRHGVL